MYLFLTPRILIIPLLSCLLLSGCAAKREVNDIFSNDSGMWGTLPKEDLERERNALMTHQFITGRIALNSEDDINALPRLARANRLSNGEDASLGLDVALLYLRKGDIQSAYENVKQVVQSSENASVYLLYAGLAQALRLEGESENAYRTLMKLGDDSALPLLSFQLANQARDQDLISLLSEQRDKKNETEEASLEYLEACVYERQGSLSKSAALLKKLVKEHPSNQRFIRHYFKVMLKRNYSAKKIKAALKGVELPEDIAQSFDIINDSNLRQELIQQFSVLDFKPVEFSELYYELALRELQNKNYNKAELHLLLSVAQKPDSQDSTISGSHYYLASLLAATGRSKLGIEELQKIELESPMFVESRVFESFLWKKRGNLAEAESSIRKAYRKDSTDVTLLVHLVDILQEQGKYDQAIGVLTEALKPDPLSSRLNYMLGIVLEQSGDARGAMHAMEKVIQVEPQHAQALNHVAYSLASLNERLDYALDLITRALALNENDGYFLDTLGWIQFKMGRYEESLATLEKAVAITGDDPTILEHYADCLIKLNQSERGLNVYVDALEAIERKEDEELASQEVVPRLQEKIADIVDKYPELIRYLP